MKLEVMNEWMKDFNDFHETISLRDHKSEALILILFYYDMDELSEILLKFIGFAKRERKKVVYILDDELYDD